MTSSQVLRDLSVRAQAAEDSVASARQESKEELHARLVRARRLAHEHSEDLHRQAEAAGGAGADWWRQVEAAWAHEAERVRDRREERREARETRQLRRRAEEAEAEAEVSIAFAMAAIDQAEYAALEAALARAEADAVAPR